MKKLGIIFLASCLVVFGCVSGDTKATPQEEQSFRNPPKQMPGEAAESMKKAAEEAKQKQGK